MKTSLTDSSRQSLSSDGQGSRFILALGSNAGQEEAMATALCLLSRHLDVAGRTEAVWTEPVEGATGRFLNCLVSGRTAMGLPELTALTKAIEQQCGRTPGEVAAGLTSQDNVSQLTHIVGGLCGVGLGLALTRPDRRR